jgi:uncharacterized protein with FMN-binding domain
MRRIVVVVLLTVSAVVLLFSYHTSTMGPQVISSAARAQASVVGGGAAATPGGPDTTTSAPPPPGDGPGSTGLDAPTTTGPATTVPATTIPARRQVDGALEDTPRGPVQVRATFQGHRILEVAAIVLPSGDRRDEEINRVAVPILRSEVLRAQSANVDMVSGATLTSTGYLASLQSAIDLVHQGG